MLRKIAGAVVATALSTTLVCAQTSPNLHQGQVLTPAQWNQLFINKQDTLGYVPLNVAGGVMSGRLVTSPPGASTAGFNMTPGSAPASPADGDMWVTSSALFARINGVTLNLSSGASVTPAALTKVDDANVTLTLGGTPATALLQATSLTLGWTGQLSMARGGLNANLTASNGGIFYSTGSAGAILAGTATAGQMVRSGSSAAPTWSTTVWPNTVSANLLLYASSANSISGLATANNSILRTDGSGVPSLSTTLPALTLGGTIAGGGNTISNLGEIDTSHLFVGSGSSPATSHAILITKTFSAGNDIAGIQNSFTASGASSDIAGMFVAPSTTASAAITSGLFGVRVEKVSMGNSSTVDVYKAFSVDDLALCSSTGNNLCPSAQWAFFATGAGSGGKSQFGQTFIVSDSLTGSGAALTIGAGTASSSVFVNINGGGTGNGSGGYIVVQGGGTNESIIGAHSGIFGGAHNAAFALTSKSATVVEISPGLTGAAFSQTVTTTFNPSGGIGIGTATDPGAGGLLATGSLKSNSASAGIGYATGAGCNVTQTGSRTSAVTCNGVSGKITLVSAAGSGSSSCFAVNNTSIAANDTVSISQLSGTDRYIYFVGGITAGTSFNFCQNDQTGTTTEQPVFQFNIIKGVQN